MKGKVRLMKNNRIILMIRSIKKQKSKIQSFFYLTSEV